MEIGIIDRKSKKEIRESEVSGDFVTFLYKNIFGRILLSCIFARPYFSRLMAIYYKSPLSRGKVKPFILEYGLNKGLLKREYKSFYHFFSRKEEVMIQKEPVGFYAAASGKLRVFKIGEKGDLYLGKKRVKVEIKGNDYDLNKLLKCELPDWARGGYLLLYRLSMSDYHRYIYPARGYCMGRKKIKGRLESVRKSGAYWRAFAENKREVEYWHTDRGEIIHIEIGAMLVGHIHNHYKRNFCAGEEKGYFSLGGSAIVEIVSSKVEIDGDILENSKKGFETKIQIGEKIGYGKNKAT